MAVTSKIRRQGGAAVITISGFVELMDVDVGGTGRRAASVGDGVLMGSSGQGRKRHHRRRA